MKKLLSYSIIFMLAFTKIAVQAQVIWDGTSDISWYQNGQTTFRISTPEQLAGVAELVNSGVTFSGCTLHLANFIWLNETGDSTNNWTPIGGGSPSSEAPVSGNSFQGVFNGHGFIIYNLYCEKSSVFHAGLFGALQYPARIDSVVLVNPVLKSRGMMGAIAGFTRNGGEVHIQGCMAINARITGTPGANNNNIGGLIGATYPNSSTTYVENCGVTGHIAGNVAGGLGGNCLNSFFSNCYFAGTIQNYSQNTGGIAAFGGFLHNCYSYSNITTESQSGTIVSQAEMQSDSILILLGGAFKHDSGINNGYPILGSMAGILTPSADICLGESVTLYSFGYDSHWWSTGDTTQNLTVAPEETTTYTLIAPLGHLTDTIHVVVTVHPQAEVTAEVMAAADGLPHATLNEELFTLECQSTDSIFLVVTPEAGWRVNRITLNNNEIYGDIFGEGEVTVPIYPNGTLGHVKVFLSNTYNIRILTVTETGDTLTLDNLVTPYGNNGVFTALSGTDQTFTFDNTLRYTLTDVTVDGISQGPVPTYQFTDIHENHTLVATYLEFCGIHSLPFTDNFESAATASVPDCYTAIQSFNYPDIQNSTANAHSGSKSLHTFLYSSSYNHYIVLPKIADTVAHPLSALRLTFWAKTTDVSNSFTVGVMTNPTDPGSFSPVVTLPANSTNYSKYTAIIGEAGIGHEYVAIRFNCGTTYTESNIDDVTLDFAPQCTPIMDLSLSHIYGTNVMMSWMHNYVGDTPEYTVIVKDLSDGSENSYTTSETFYVVTGLTEYRQYQLGVFATCSEDQTGDTAFISLSTPCTSPINANIGNGSLTTSRFPSNSCYNYSYTQQIIPAEAVETGAMSFTSLYFQCTSVASATRNLDIYLSTVPNGTNMAAGWILPSDSIPFFHVFSGNVAITSSTPGNWFEIPLAFPFNYNGTDDILISVADNTGSWHCSNYFKCHEDANTAYRSRYTYRDPSPYSITNPQETGFVSNEINNIRFSSCDPNSCIRPNTLLANNVMEHSADITWVSPMHGIACEMEYKAYNDTAWTSVGPLGTESYSFNELLSNTEYTVRIRTLCDNDESLWSDPLVFRTNCASIDLPFYEDFEDVSGIYNSGVQENYIVCWNRYASNPLHYVYIPETENYARSGSHFLDFHYTNDCYNIAILPPIGDDVDIRDLMTSFWASRTGITGLLEVGVMTDPDLAVSFVPVDTIDLSENDFYEYAEQFVSFGDYSGNGTYIAFRVSNAEYCGFYIDDITVDIRPACSDIRTMEISETNSTSVLIAWEPGPFGTIDNYTLEYSEEGMENWTSITIDSTTFLIENLAPSTYYDLRVKVNCDDTTSSYWTELSFRTKCLVGGDIAIGNGTTTDSHLPSYSFYKYSYSQQLFLASELGGPKNIEALTLDMATYATDRLFHIYLMHTSATSAADWIDASNAQLVFDFPQQMNLGLNTFQFSTPFMYNGHDNLLLIIIDMSGNYESGNSWRTHATPFPSSKYIYHDPAPYTIYETPSSGVSGYLPSRNNVIFHSECDTSLLCASPSISVTSITSNSAVVNWVPGYDDDLWELEYSIMGDSNWVSLGTVTSLSEPITGLSSNTIYRVHMRSICGSSFSYWTEVTFTTDCDPITVTATTPWFEDFESIIGGGPEQFICWKTPVVDNVYHGPYLYCGHYPSCHSGANSAEFKGGVNMLALPAFTNDIHTLRLSFWATAIDPYAGVLEIGILPDPTDPSSFELVGISGTPSPRGTNDASGNGNFMGPFDFDGVQATSGLIALRYTSVQLNNSWNLDDFTVELIPSCPEPYNLTASNIGTSSATISWSSSNNAQSFILEYGPAGFTPGNGTTSFTTTTTYTLTGMNNNTPYTVYVWADCGDNDISVPATLTFRTSACEEYDKCQYTFNLSDNYGDGWNGGSLQIQQNGAVVATISLESGYNSTEQVALCNNMSTSLIWIGGEYAYEAGFSLSSPEGTVLVNTSNMENYTTYNFTTSCNTSGPIVCNIPTGLTATDITANSALLTWIAGGSESQWAVQHRLATDNDWAPETITSTIPYLLTGLNSESTYEVRVKAVCAPTESSDWTAPFSFTTQTDTIVIPDSCNIPTGLAVTDTSAQAMTLTWNDDENVDLWHIQYRADNGPVLSATSTTNSYLITDLEPETHYTIQVQAECSNGMFSDWSTTVTATTPVGIVNHLARLVKLYPNPATSMITVQWAMGNGDAVIELLDVYGKLLNTVSVKGEFTTLNVSGMADGMYFVRVTTDDGSVTKPFVVKH